MYKNIIIVLSLIFTLNCQATDGGAFFYDETLHPDSKASLLIGSKTETIGINGRPLEITYNCIGRWEFPSDKSYKTGAKFIAGSGNKVHILPKKPTWFNLSSKFKREDVPYIIIEINKRC